MQTEQTVIQAPSLKADFLLWRVGNEKQRKAEVQLNSAYNLRPRERSQAHH